MMSFLRQRQEQQQHPFFSVSGGDARLYPASFRRRPLSPPPHNPRSNPPAHCTHYRGFRAAVYTAGHESHALFIQVSWHGVKQPGPRQFARHKDVYIYNTAHTYTIFAIHTTAATLMDNLLGASYTRSHVHNYI